MKETVLLTENKGIGKQLMVNGEWLHLSLRAFEESVAISMCSAIS